MSACSVHHQYSSSVSPFQAKTAIPSGFSGVPLGPTATAAAAWSCVEKMLHDTQRTLAPRSTSVSMRTAVCTVMCSDPMIRAPASGFAFLCSARMAIKPGISCSASRISFRPHSASPRSFTLKAGRSSALGAGRTVVVIDLMSPLKDQSVLQTANCNQRSALPGSRGHEQFRPFCSGIPRQGNHLHVLEPCLLQPFRHLGARKAEPDVTHALAEFSLVMWCEVDQEQATSVPQDPVHLDQDAPRIGSVVQDQGEDRRVEFRRFNRQRFELSLSKLDPGHPLRTRPGLLQHVGRGVHSDYPAHEWREKDGQVAAPAAKVAHDPSIIEEA